METGAGAPAAQNAVSYMEGLPDHCGTRSRQQAVGAVTRKPFGEHLVGVERLDLAVPLQRLLHELQCRRFVPFLRDVALQNFALDLRDIGRR